MVVGNVIVGLAVGSIAVVFMIWHFRRSRALLARWAADEGVVLVEVEERTLLTGPFWWHKSRGQGVYRIRVRDLAGAERVGWVLCGSWLLGMQSDRVEVRWDM